ncbi:CpsD/CapB family tyrosine-protein kinase [Vulgatibacter sp.]|uniref:CpsD/CapB family tyrosine-protein kinase n=1 Tax=Vulgatibacter sp. TaxID=1971226 RepID=UPI003564AE98
MDAKAIQVPAAFDGSVDPRVVSLVDPNGAAAEQFRLLHLRLDKTRAQRPLAVVALTSAVAGEGKTVTAANLAACAARRGRRVALLDCDLRRPRIAGLFGIDEGPGIAAVLGGRCRLEDAIRIGPERLTIVPAGAAPDDPGSLFSGTAFRAAIERLRGTHDEIYVDLPPALPFADAMAAANEADGVVVVVRNNETRAELVEEAVGILAGAQLIGCVLTGCEEGAAAYRKYYGKR